MGEEPEEDEGAGEGDCEERSEAVGREVVRRLVLPLVADECWDIL